MKKKPSLPETSLARYDWGRARRGHWAGKLRTSKSVLIPPEVYEQFGSDDAIRAVLVAAVQLRDAVPPKRRRRTAA
jgi:hypothetical protein